MSMPTRQAESENLSRCPFLGSQDDSYTSFAFPSDWNICHHCKPVAPVSHQHQSDYCLGANHTTCPVYLRETLGSLPRELRNQRRSSLDVGDNRAGRIILVLVLLALLLALGFGFAPQLGAFYSPANLAGRATSSPVPALAQETPTPEPILAPSVTLPSPSVIPSATPTSLILLDSINVDATPTITRIPHQIESLIGISYLFRIHRFKFSDNLSVLAHSNGTTVEAVTKVNCSLSDPIRAQEPIIIPVNQTDVSRLPCFEPYRVLEDTSLEALAEQLGVDADDLQYYNGLGTGAWLSAGEWLVVPYGETSTGTP